MSNELCMKAQNAFKHLVDLKETDKVFLDGGSLTDLLEKEAAHRQTFEYSKKTADDQRRKEKAVKKRYESNTIKFRNLSNLKTLVPKDDSETVKVQPMYPKDELIP